MVKNNLNYDMVVMSIQGEKMSRSIHCTVKSVFQNVSKNEVHKMCDSENPDYRVMELWKKGEYKREVNRKRKTERLKKLNPKQEI